MQQKQNDSAEPNKVTTKIKTIKDFGKVPFDNSIFIKKGRVVIVLKHNVTFVDQTKRK